MYCMYRGGAAFAIEMLLLYVFRNPGVVIIALAMKFNMFKQGTVANK